MSRSSCSRVSDDPSRGDGADVDLQVGGRAEPGSILQEQIVEVDRSRRMGDRSLVDPREQEEVLDEPLETRVFLEHHLRQLADRRPLGVGQGDFRELADRGDRRTELVGSVRDEPARSALSGLQPLEHPVHRGREAGDLVITRRVGNPPMEVAGRDRVHLGPDGIDGRQGPRRHEPGDQPDDEQEERHDHGQRDRERVAALDDSLQVPSYDHPLDVPRSLDVPGDQEERFIQRLHVRGILGVDRHGGTRPNRCDGRPARDVGGGSQDVAATIHDLDELLVIGRDTQHEVLQGDPRLDLLSDGLGLGESRRGHLAREGPCENRDHRDRGHRHRHTDDDHRGNGRPNADRPQTASHSAAIRLRARYPPSAASRYPDPRTVSSAFRPKGRSSLFLRCRT